MTSTFTPNADQEAAAEQFFRFLMSDDKEFRLSGGGGTGKTSLMQHIMKNVVPEYASACKLLGQTPVDYTIVLTATTNQATEVLYERTKYPAQTIHSFMNLKVKETSRPARPAVSAPTIGSSTPGPCCSLTKPR